MARRPGATLTDRMSVRFGLAAEVQLGLATAVLLAAAGAVLLAAGQHEFGVAFLPDAYPGEAASSTTAPAGPAPPPGWRVGAREVVAE